MTWSDTGTTQPRSSTNVGGEAVTQLVGDDESEPYVQRRLVVVGIEQHVIAGSEEIVIEVERSAQATDHRHGLWTSHWAPADHPLSATARAELELPETFTGVFRAAVILDFGKSLPPFLLADALDELPPEMLAALGDELPLGRQLEDRAFVERLEAAFGAPLIEVGFVY